MEGVNDELRVKCAQDIKEARERLVVKKRKKEEDDKVALSKRVKEQIEQIKTKITKCHTLEELENLTIPVREIEAETKQFFNDIGVVLTPTPDVDDEYYCSLYKFYFKE